MLRYIREFEIWPRANLIRYEPGDHLGIYPENDPKLVECYGKRLDVDDLDAIVSLENENGSTVLGPCTIRNALSYYCDLTSCPRKLKSCFVISVSYMCMFGGWGVCVCVCVCRLMGMCARVWVYSCTCVRDL